MTTPTPTHGSKAVFKMGTVATPTVVTAISEYLNSTGLPFSRDKSDVSTFGSTTKRYVFGLKDAEIPIDGPFDPVTDAVLYDSLNSDVEIDFEYYPAGEVSGLPFYSGKLIVSKYEVKSEVGGANTMSGAGQVSGEVTRALVP